MKLADSWGTYQERSKIDELYAKKQAETEAKILEMAKKKEQEEKEKEYARHKAILLENAKKEMEEHDRRIELAKRKAMVQQELPNNYWDSYFGNEDKILALANKKRIVNNKYLFIYQIEEEGLQTEELTPEEMEERIDRFGLSCNNYVIINNGKVVEFPVNNTPH